MKLKQAFLTLSLILTASVLFSSDALAKSLPIEYRVRINTADLSTYAVEVRIAEVKGTIRMAMAAHPEYDDRYFRYVESFTAEAGGNPLAVTKPEAAIWQIDNARAGLVIRYLVRPAAKERQWRQTWKPYLTETGGMIGDLHMLMYPVGSENAQARLTIDMPSGWSAASGLAPAREANVFTGSVEDLLDSPVIVGKFDEWKFEAGGVPHQVVIFTPPDKTAVDPKPIVDGIKKLTDASINAFGKPPYPRYAFLLENGGSAALEHKTSLNAGIPAVLSDLFEDIAHEYIHVWNLMDVRPRERIGVRYKFAEPTKVLWWSEGATIMFSDLLIRRSGIPREERSRTERLESMIARYHSSDGYWKVSAEDVSRGDSHPELLGNYFASTHLQGELLVTMLDLMIRDRSDGTRSAADVMRLLAERFDSTRGITNSDIERAVADVCSCDAGAFFDEYIRSPKMIELDRYLAVIGLRSEVKQIPSVDDQGRAVVDLRIGPSSGEGEFTLRVMNSESTWARSGIRTGDRLISADGRPMPDWNAFRGWLRSLKIGDKGRMVIQRDGKELTVEVPITGFDRASATVTAASDATPKQIRLREAWLGAR